ncbi:TIGR00341 family protein [Natrarchaeobaculum sulfurireducens]|uniref:TIGR00341 family protein n=1 Tax=Natrarchaeobaculum sulfurireducens TaxID=2044521 RepID=A0A346PD33_9EURY|nr:TIGR00341 family protein [Natrarchaeobaculum sulfurireducens]AXR77428.1 hypothetical protein AArc1_1087 [Natrarchaeobaculum sulfurireducens]
MRYIEITIPSGKRRAVLDILDDEGIEYVVSDEIGHQQTDAVVRFPLPTRAVEGVLDRLAEAELSTARVVVIDAETVISEEFDELRKLHRRGTTTGERTSRQVLVTKADELTPAFSIYVVMLLISAVVATSGLLSDSPAVVVGSMVIAPLLGPALAASVGIVTGDGELRTRGFRYQVVGVAVVIAASIGLATLARLAGLEPGGVDIVVVAELEERVSPNLFSLAVALGAGVAGILSLTRGFSEAIVGVMIAAALIPPAAAVGITTAWGMYGAALGAFGLVAINVLSINAAALVTLWLAGYRPQGLFEVSPTRRQTATYAAVFAVGLLALSTPLVGITLLEFQTTQLKSTAEGEVETVLEEPDYDGVEAESVEVILDDDYPLRSIDRVVVTVRTDGVETDPELGTRLSDAVSAEVDDPPIVEVRYVLADQHGSDEQPALEPTERQVVHTVGDRSDNEEERLEERRSRA